MQAYDRFQVGCASSTYKPPLPCCINLEAVKVYAVVTVFYICKELVT